MFKANRLKAMGFLPICAALAMVVGLAAPRAVLAQDSKAVLDAAQTEAIERLIHDYLLANPEVLVEALQTYEQRQQAAEADRLRAAVVAEAAALNEDPAAPVLGNPQGDVTLVEFFDYRCPYCKRMTGILEELLQSDPNLRLVMKEFPILSRESVEAARAALAAVKQEKYQAFHFALMEDGGSFTDDEIMAVATAVGLDIERLRRDMQDPEIEAALRRTNSLAQKIGVTGTPAFVVGDTMLPGAVGIEQLRALIAEARAKAS